MNISLIIDVFRKSCAVKDAVKGKNRAMLGIAIGGLISLAPVLAKAAGYELTITQDDANQLGTSIATLAGLFGIYATSDKVGILPAKTVPNPEPPIQHTPQEELDLRGGP